MSGELLSHALHGRVMPLFRELGAPPAARLRRKADQKCSLADGRCVGATSNCYPCEKLPDCYNAPSSDPAISKAASIVVSAWRMGFYVIVVTEEGEFTL